MTRVMKCDKCKNYFEDEKDMFSVRIYQLGISGFGNRKKFSCHLCYNCYKKLLEGLKE